MFSTPKPSVVTSRYLSSVSDSTLRSLQSREHPGPGECSSKSKKDKLVTHRDHWKPKQTSCFTVLCTEACEKLSFLNVPNKSHNSDHNQTVKKCLSSGKNQSAVYWPFDTSTPVITSGKTSETPFNNYQENILLLVLTGTITVFTELLYYYCIITLLLSLLLLLAALLLF